MSWGKGILEISARMSPSHLSFPHSSLAFCAVASAIEGKGRRREAFEKFHFSTLAIKVKTLSFPSAQQQKCRFHLDGSVQPTFEGLIRNSFDTNPSLISIKFLETVPYILAIYEGGSHALLPSYEVTQGMPPSFLLCPQSPRNNNLYPQYPSVAD